MMGEGGEKTCCDHLGRRCPIQHSSLGVGTSKGWLRKKGGGPPLPWRRSGVSSPEEEIRDYHRQKIADTIVIEKKKLSEMNEKNLHEERKSDRKNADASGAEGESDWMCVSRDIRFEKVKGELRRGRGRKSRTREKKKHCHWVMKKKRRTLPTPTALL